MKNKMKQTKLVVFDLDGTLVDSNELYIDTIHNHLVMNYFMFTKGHVARALGPKIEETLKNLGKFDKKTVKKLKKDINEFVARESSKLKLCPNVHKALKELKLKKIKIVLLTNSASKYTRLLLRKNKLLKYFNEVITAENFDNKPQAIKKLAKKYRLKIKEIVYVGDRVKDIKVAKKAGCKIIIALACSWDKKKFKNGKKKFIIKNLGELKNAISI